MNRLPKEIKKDLKEEAKEWDRTIAKESPEHVQKMLDQAESFKIPRPPRQPVSIRLDPFDIAMAKRIARERVFPPPNSWPPGFTKELNAKMGLVPTNCTTAVECIPWKMFAASCTKMPNAS